MSSSLFQVTEHVLPCQHIRGNSHAVTSETAILQLAIKEYRPLDNLDASPGSITIIATHANGFPKETYEPLWDDLYRARRLKIGSIWTADTSHQGASGILNEDIQGDDPHWFDHSRDLLSMVNHFRERMPRPIFGIGHSMGCAQLCLSCIHVSIHGLILVEPVIIARAPQGPNAAFLSSHRPDLWPSRAGAEASFRRNKFFKDWDPRTLEKFVQFGLRETPTAVYPDSEAGAVTLTTTKHQEAWSYLRSNFTPQSNSHHEPVEHLLSPDVAPTDAIKYVFNRPECALSLLGLPYLRPSVLWVYGEHSPINVPEIRKEKMPLTGSGIGGSGGLQTGKVEEVVFEEAGHMVPMEKVKECGELMARWLEKQVEEFRTEEAFYREYDSKKSERGRLVMSKEWLQGVRRKADSKRPVKGKL